MDNAWKCCFLIISTFGLQSVCLHYSGEPSTPTLWGKKVNFMLSKCSYLRLREDHWIPKLDEVTVCVDLWTQILTQDWTVFVYKKRDRKHPQLGLVGNGENLRVWLLGHSWLSRMNFSLHSWHAICLTWSGPHQRLNLYVNGTIVNLKEKTYNSTGPLSPNGTLTLGMSHGFTNGNLVPELGHSMPGCVSLFRMWDQEYSAQQLWDLRCAKGNLVRWTASDWDMDGCQAIPDASLECEDVPSETTLLPLSMSSAPTTSTSAGVGPTSSQTPLPTFKDNFFRVSLNVIVSTGSADSEIIHIWLQKTLEKDKMYVLNLKITTSNLSTTGLFLERESAIAVQHFLMPRSSHSCKFQVQTQLSLSVAETEERIRKHLQNHYNLSEHVQLIPETKSIQILHIEPGACLEQSQQTREGLYIWPQTEVQQTATMLCEGDPSQTATRICSLDAMTEQGRWTPPDLHLCPLVVGTIHDLKTITVLPNTSMEVVEIIGNLTSCHTKLSFTELVIVLTLLDEVVNVSQMTPPLGTAIVNIISNIIASESDLSLVTNNILNITDTIGSKMTINRDQYSMTAPSLAISVVNVDPGNFRGLSFGVSTVSQEDYPKIFINQDPFDNTVAFISLPHVVESYFPQLNGTLPRIQFHFYGTLALFKDINSKMKLNTYVVSANVTNATVEDLEKPIVVSLHHLQPNLHNDEVQCVYWDYKKNEGLGGWESSGCRVNHTTITHTTCLCNHLTHFGILLDVSRMSVSKVDEEILTIISYLGCGISSVFLGISLLTYVAFEKLRRDYPSKILLNLSIALLGLNLVFLVNSWLSSFNSYGLCVVVAAVQHYTLLTSFTWMGLEAVHMYFALVKVFNVYVPAYMLKFCALGWGIPLVIISLVLLVKTDAYGSIPCDNSVQGRDTVDQFCWLQSDAAFYTSVVAYALLVLLCNVSVFIVVLVQIHKIRESNAAGQSGRLLHDLRGVASLTFLLGLTWILAFFTWGPAKVALLYLFAILNSLQGFFVFLFHCLMKESVRTQWRIHLCCGRFRLTEHSDLSHTATFGMKCRHNQLTHHPSVKSSKSDLSNSTNSTSGSSHSDQQPTSTRRAALDLSSEKALVLPRAQLCSSLLLPEMGSYPQWNGH